VGPEGSEGHHLLGMAMLLQGAPLAAELQQQALAHLFIGPKQLLQFGEVGAGPRPPVWTLERAGDWGIG